MFMRILYSLRGKKNDQYIADLYLADTEEVEDTNAILYFGKLVDAHSDRLLSRCEIITQAPKMFEILCNLQDHEGKITEYISTDLAEDIDECIRRVLYVDK